MLQLQVADGARGDPLGIPAQVGGDQEGQVHPPLAHGQAGVLLLARAKHQRPQGSEVEPLETDLRAGEASDVRGEVQLDRSQALALARRLGGEQGRALLALLQDLDAIEEIEVFLGDGLRSRGRQEGIGVGGDRQVEAPGSLRPGDRQARHQDVLDVDGGAGREQLGDLARTRPQLGGARQAGEGEEALEARLEHPAALVLLLLDEIGEWIDIVGGRFLLGQLEPHPADGGLADEPRALAEGASVDGELDGVDLDGAGGGVLGELAPNPLDHQLVQVEDPHPVDAPGTTSPLRQDQRGARSQPALEGGATHGGQQRHGQEQHAQEHPRPTPSRWPRQARAVCRA